MKPTNAAATLASVVFLKIQEFARRPVQEQARLRAQLEAVVAVTAAELAPASRIVLDAMADASPGLESGLFPAGVFTDAGLRTHELFSPDGRVAERRRTRFFALAVAAVIGLVGAGVAARVSAEGHQKFVDGVVVKIRQTIAQGERVLGGLIEKVQWQKRN